MQWGIVYCENEAGLLNSPCLRRVRSNHRSTTTHTPQSQSVTVTRYSVTFLTQMCVRHCICSPHEHVSVETWPKRKPCMELLHKYLYMSLFCRNTVEFNWIAGNSWCTLQACAALDQLQTAFVCTIHQFDIHISQSLQTQICAKYFAFGTCLHNIKRPASVYLGCSFQSWLDSSCHKFETVTAFECGTSLTQQEKALFTQPLKYRSNEWPCMVYIKYTTGNCLGILVNTSVMFSKSTFVWHAYLCKLPGVSKLV